MYDGQVVESDEVKARWVLSELASARTSRFYCKSSLEDITQKITASLTFESLSPAEVERLLHAFECARGQYLYHYLQGILQFKLGSWPMSELEGVWAMSQMSGGRFILLRDFAKTPFEANATDPRFVAAQMASAGVPVRSEHPVTIGIYKGMRVLVDGYARSLLFLQAAQDGDRLRVFVPVVRD
jgi:hypothetical protein